MMKIAFCKSTTPIPSNRYWSIKRVLVPQAPKILNHLCGKSLEPNGRPISRSHSFKSNRNTATQLCLKLYWHAVFHTQEHTTILQRSYQHCLGALGAGLTSGTLCTHSILVRKTQLRAPPSYGRAFKTSQPVLHECGNQQFLLVRPTNPSNNYYCALHLFVGAYSSTWVFCQQPW